MRAGKSLPGRVCHRQHQSSVGVLVGCGNGNQIWAVDREATDGFVSRLRAVPVEVQQLQWEPRIRLAEAERSPGVVTQAIR